MNKLNGHIDRSKENQKIFKKYKDVKEYLRKREERKPQYPVAFLLPFHLRETSSENFIQVAKDCVRNLDILSQDSIIEYYRLNGSRKTLEEIGQKYELTRERVRQVKSDALKGIIKVFKGRTYHKYRCDSVVLHDIYALYDELKRYKMVSDEGLNVIFNRHRMMLDSDQFRLFCDIFNIQRTYSHYHHPYYRVVRGYGASAFDIARKKIDDLLREGFILTLEDIQRKRGMPKRLLPSILLSVPHVDGKYQIPFKELKVYAQIHRVFLERRCKLHYKDVCHEFKKRGVKDPPRIALSQNKFIEPIGKTGYWVLKGTAINRDTYSAMIEKIIKALGAPIDPSNIARMIKMSRPEFKKNSIHNLISSPRFLRLKDGRVILAKWYTHYKGMISKHRKKNLSISPRAIKSALKIMRGREFRPYELAHMISLDTGISQQSCVTFLYRSPFFNRRKEGRKVYYSLNGKEKTIKTDLERNTYRDKFKAIRLYIKAKIEKNGPQKRRKLIEETAQELKVSKIYVYEVIRASTEIFNIGERNLRQRSNSSLISLHEK